MYSSLDPSFSCISFLKLLKRESSETPKIAKHLPLICLLFETTSSVHFFSLLHQGSGDRFYPSTYLGC